MLRGGMQSRDSGDVGAGESGPMVDETIKKLQAGLIAVRMNNARERAEKVRYMVSGVTVWWGVVHVCPSE